ncbi:hypothetical protein UT300019_08650 [Clostridium sp. CTA-19]
MLCSSNNYRADDVLFNSFGDGNGFRKDIYRYFRMIPESIDEGIKFHSLNIAYMDILDDFNNIIAKECGSLIKNIFTNNRKYVDLNNKERKLANFLIELNYLNIDKANGHLNIDVPVFFNSERDIIQRIGEIILLDILPYVEKTFMELKRSMDKLTSIKHEVSIKDIGNELWHQIFGYTNEYLVKSEFVATPKFKEGEGRYLQSIVI